MRRHRAPVNFYLEAFKWLWLLAILLLGLTLTIYGIIAFALGLVVWGIVICAGLPLIVRNLEQ